MAALPVGRSGDHRPADHRPEASAAEVVDHVAAPGSPMNLVTAPDAVPLPSPVAMMVLHRARIRATTPLDVVSFVAACPACGQDCEWTQERDETRVRSTTGCPCRP